MTGCNNRRASFGFSRKEIDETAKSSRLLTLEIEFGLRCNFRCQYCYVSDNTSFKNEMTKEEVCDVVLQAEALGVRRIIILGGEPMICPHTLEMIRFIRSRGIKPEMFTNGFQITPDVARELFRNNVSVTLKMDSFNENVQDMLAGLKGASKSIWEAFHNLKKAGYPSEDNLLSISTIICRQNIDELVNMWQWLREQNIAPYFEMLTPQGHARQNEWLNVEISKIHNIFREISEIDRLHYDYTWDPQPPLVANKCLRHQYSCLVNAHGYVMPCVGVPIPVGNIRERKLSDILNDSEVIRDLRNYRSTIKEPCHSCEKVESCYGCRGTAYQLTGDYLASDPLCWRNMGRQEEIVSLPITVDAIIPQQLPMRLIDSLDRIGERRADATVKITKDMPFVGNGGKLDGAAFLEMMAQTAAAMQGIKKVGLQASSKEGFLLGCKKLKVYGKAFAGETLKISVYKVVKYAEFGILEGTITRRDKILARGEFKIWYGTGDKKETLVRDMV